MSSRHQDCAISGHCDDRVYAKYKRRVSFDHGWSVFNDTPQSIYIQVEDQNHDHCTNSEYRHSRQVNSGKVFVDGRYAAGLMAQSHGNVSNRVINDGCGTGRRLFADCERVVDRQQTSGRRW